MNEGVAKELVQLAFQALGDHSEAIRATRAVLRWFGGQLIYLPLNPEGGRKAGHVEKLRGILADEIGEGDGNSVLGAWMKLLGGGEIYLPLEHTAFRDTIAIEVFRRYDGHNMGDMVRDYGVSYVQVYRLFHRGKSLSRKGEPSLFED